MNRGSVYESPTTLRFGTLRIAVLSILGGLAVYLFVLQVMKGDEFDQDAKNNALKETVVPAQRGSIYDGSYTRPLVGNQPAFSIDVTPGLVTGKIADLFSSLADVLDVSPKYLASKVSPNERRLFQPIEVLSGAEFATVAYLGEHIDRFPGVRWRNEPVRDYRSLGALAHVIGYVGEISV